MDEDDKLLGHATFVLFPYEPLGGRGVWITQFVVKSSARDCGVARRLLTAAVFMSNQGDVVAAGIASSHQHTIRAFKRATSSLDLDLEFIASQCISLKLSLKYSLPPLSQQYRLRFMAHRAKC